MLEQELQNQEVNSNFNENQGPTPQPQPEAELFEQYEVKNWNFSPRLYKIAAISAIFNLLAVFVFTQGNLLTTRGCDSPMVSKVCQVLDTVYVGSQLLGTDSEFVSKDYDPTELGDAEITYIDVSGQTPPLNYPEGYFALANPEEFALRQQQQQMMLNAENPSGFEMPPTGSIPFPGIPGGSPSSTFSGGNDLKNTKPVFPKANKNAVIGDLPTSTSGNPIGSSPNRNFPSGKNRPKKNLPNESPKTLPGDEDLAENEKDKSGIKQTDLSSLPVAEEVINKKPLQDFGEDVLTKVEAKKVDLTKSFTVVLQGSIDKEFKFDPKKSNYVKTDGDEEMINIAKSAIEAIGDSGILVYLKNVEVNVDKINFTLIQDDKFIYAIITSPQKSESHAKSSSSRLNNAISFGKLTVKEADTLALLNAAKVENKGNNFVLNFKIDKPIAQEMITRQLQKAEAKRQQNPQPNGTADAKPNQNTAK